MEISRQDYWSGLPFPTPGDLLDPGIESVTLEAPASAGEFFTTRATWETLVCAKSLQSRLTLCNPMDCHPPGSSVHGILQARILEWVAVSFSRGFPDTGIKPGSPAL